MQLRWWGHLIFAVGYCSVAAVTVLLLALFRPQTDVVVIVLAGAVVVLAGGLVHEVVTRRANQRKLFERQMRTRQAYEDLVEMILKMKASKSKTAPAKGEEPGAPPPFDPPPAVPHAPPEPPPALQPPPPEPPPPRRAAAVPVKPPLSPAEAETAAMIREALAEERIEAFIQPIVTLPARKPRFFELLSRIHLRNDTLVLPEQYLAVAERENLLPAIDELCFARATQLIRETDRHHHAIGFFCNVAAQTLGDAAFLNRFLGGGGDPLHLHTKLVFEMNQRDLSAELLSPLSALGELAAVGFRFSMDRIERYDIDVEALVRHQVQYLKINSNDFAKPETRSAVAGLMRRLEGQPVEVVVEKVEAEWQLNDLEDLKLELGQGYLFGEPRLSRRTS